MLRNLLHLFYYISLCVYKVKFSVISSVRMYKSSHNDVLVTGPSDGGWPSLFFAASCLL